MDERNSIINKTFSYNVRYNTITFKTMDTTKVDYNTLSAEHKKLWVKHETERQRLKWRNPKTKAMKNILKY